MSSVDNICLKHFVSSANSNSCEVMTDGKSLMNIKKSKGPSMNQTQLGLFVLHYILNASPSPFFEFINDIIGKHYLTQYLPVQSLHTSKAILFCDIGKRHCGYRRLT